ncbi:hypothetical protein ACVW0K_005866 [Streptomyces filamentosus]|uniref:hypothetical protein n=1 Tax=Streptomyces filamentosus TaxID=67294 RepID=UPI0033E7541F
MRRGPLLGVLAAAALAAAVGAAGGAGSRRARETSGPWPRMPDFRGRALWRVFTRLDHRTRLDVHDASGRDRRVLWPPRWRVCTQYPAAGTGLDRRTTVVIGVLRKGEPCPVRVTTARR